MDLEVKEGICSGLMVVDVVPDNQYKCTIQIIELNWSSDPVKAEIGWEEDAEIQGKLNRSE